MKPEEFIAFAGKVATFDRAGARSAVSRAYYGAYHAALELLSELGCELSARASHEARLKLAECPVHRRLTPC